MEPTNNGYLSYGFFVAKWQRGPGMAPPYHVDRQWETRGVYYEH
jgi:hypothetical protein